MSPDMKSGMIEIAVHEPAESTPLDPRVAILQSPDSSAEAINDAFKSIMQEFSAPMHSRAYRITGNTDLADDVVQEAFTRAYEKRLQFIPKKPVVNWLMKITSNRAFDEIKSSSRRKPHKPYDETASIAAYRFSAGRNMEFQHYEDPAIIVEEKDARQKQHDSLNEILMKLTPDQKAAVDLQLQGLNHDEIANKLSIPVSAVKARLYRARQELQELLIQEPSPPIAALAETTPETDPRIVVIESATSPLSEKSQASKSIINDFLAANKKRP